MQQPIPVLHFHLAFLALSLSALLRLLFRSQGFAFPGLPRLRLAMTGKKGLAMTTRKTTATPPFVIARSGNDKAISRVVAISFQPLANC